MNHNPYSAPRASVDDVPSVGDRVRPRTVVRAVWLLWIAIGVNFVGSLIESLLPNPDLSIGQSLTFALIGFAVAVAIYSWLITAAWRGRAWSRIVQVVLLLLSFATNYFLSEMDPELYDIPMYVSAIYLAGTLIEIAGLALLFSPGVNAWYRAMRG
jgi:hypothetical protein